MKLRPPSIPLITVDPYFSVWSPADRLYDEVTEHWTGSPNTLFGYVNIDGERFRFMGDGEDAVIPQTDFEMNAFVSHYTFGNEKIMLDVSFFTPVFPDDLMKMSRPVSYVSFNFISADGCSHNVSVKIGASEELVLNKKGEGSVATEICSINGLNTAKMGSEKQDILHDSGDDIRIDWGYFYLTVPEKDKVYFEKIDDMIFASADIALEENKEAYALFSYDDIYSLQYFGKNVKSYWKKNGKTIEEAIAEAYNEAEEICDICYAKAIELEMDALIVGGEKYADLVALASRQVIAAHKLCADDEGNAIFISKECFSNGCAATVDVTYPSSPMFIYYNTELLKAMLRPIFKFADSDVWEFDFAPHDVGQYPLVNGQVYGTNHIEDGRYKDFQMPVEECGNMIIMLANISLRDGNTDFFDLYKDTVAQWVKYLLEYGMDPENQLCTDDFAGHLAHNCNLSLKAIMGVAGYSLMLKMKGETAESERYMAEARSMADNWVKNAANSDGSFRLAFDREDTFSMKYNMVWDKIWGTGLFAPSVYYSEFCSNKKRFNAYGMPLDNRKTYTKSDWIMWTACLAPTDKEFEEYIEPMWNCYNQSPSRVPMTDWYDTVTSLMVGFRHRSVQGGMFIKMLSLLDCFSGEEY